MPHRNAQRNAERQIKIGVERAREGLDDARQELEIHAEEAREFVDERKVEAQERIRENPLMYVVGAFVGGVILGTLISRRQ